MGINNGFVYDKSDETFQYLLSTLKDSIKNWDYFVNWKKVDNNIREFEIELNLLNYLIGKENLEEEFRYLLKNHPEVLNVIPTLIACRDNKFKITYLKDNNTFDYKLFDFKKKKHLNDEDIDNAVIFAEKSGIFNLFRNNKIKNLVDYVFGVEVGLDSNGRKNRTGKAMEDLVELLIKNICEKYNYKYISQATPTRIKSDWNYDVTIDKSERRFDFAVNTGEKLYLIETNFYSGGGSKLKATAGEYKTLYDVITRDGHDFIWITDGVGWRSANRPLQEAFNHNKYVLNLKMVELGVLEQIFSNQITI